MDKAPKHKIGLIIGVVLFVASPFLFFWTPDWFFQALLCSPETTHGLFTCAHKVYAASFYLSVITLIVGAILMFWALRNSSKPSIFTRLFRSRYRAAVITVTIFVAVWAIYIFLLTSPFTGSWFQHPYYKAFCGKEPIIATTGEGFSGTIYIKPGMKNYQIGGFNQRLFCTIDAARAHDSQYRPYFKD